MIKKQSAKIVSSEQIAKETIEIVLENEYISQRAKPGQFVHVAVRGHTLRRPISIAATDLDKNTFTILFKTIGSGTTHLADYTVGEDVDLLGPNGTSFPIDKIKEEETLLLVGGGIGVPPIYFLATELAKLKVNVHTVLGFQSKDYLFYEKQFNELGNVTIVTDDGSYGKQGFVTNYLQQADQLDKYFSCGPMPMLKAVKNSLSDIEGYLSFEEHMACGIGACYACVIPVNTPEQYKKICQDGPVLAASEVKI